MSCYIDSEGMVYDLNGMRPIGHVDESQDMLVRLARTHPGLVRTLSILHGELDSDSPEGEMCRELGAHLVDVGEGLLERANHVVVDEQ